MWKENLISLLLVALLKCHVGSALNCYTCVGECKDATPRTCRPEELCMTRKVITNGILQGQQKGCLSSEMCNHTSSIESFHQWCCNTDLCNTEIPRPVVPVTTVTPVTSKPYVSSSAPNTSASALTCYSCGYACVMKSAIVCKPNQVCGTKYIKLANLDLKGYDCLNSSVCSTETKEHILGTTVTVMNKCCTSNLCNSGAAALTRPVFIAIGALLFLWLAKLS